MGTEWMGRYRPLVAALVRHTNIVQRTFSKRAPLTEGISLTAQEWQVFEYILEHQEDDSCMNCISEQLGIPQSTFSKIAKLLCELGLVDKYQAENNRKNIILRPSDMGAEIYRRHAAAINQASFKGFFSELESLSDDELAVFTAALEKLDRALSQDEPEKQKPRLIKKV